jgi:hypothetical protein
MEHVPGDYYSEPPRQWKPTEQPSEREQHLAEVLSVILDSARRYAFHRYDIIITTDDLTYENWERLAQE